MTLILSILIFIITFVKSVFDLFISPYLFKKELSSQTALKAAEIKRNRESKSTTLVFIFITLISAFSIWESSMNSSEKDLEDLQKRVTRIEEFLFPPDGGPSLAMQLAKITQSIDELESEIIMLSETKADQAKLNETIKILAKLKEVLKSIELKKQAAGMAAH